MTFFFIILPANKQVPETNEVHRILTWELDDVWIVGCEVYCYRGIVADRAFMDTNPDHYSKLCSIEVDLSHLRHLSNTSNVRTLARGSGGFGVYYEVDVDVVMLFGGTEIEARLCWKENGVEKRSNAEVLYTDNLPREPCASGRD